MTKAQNIAEPGKPYDYFCVVFIGNWSKAYVMIPSSPNYEAIMNTDGKKISFYHVSDLLTYMSKRGWKYVESAQCEGKPAYVMKKTVNKDEEAKVGLLLESDFEQNKKD